MHITTLCVHLQEAHHAAHRSAASCTSLAFPPSPTTHGLCGRFKPAPAEPPANNKCIDRGGLGSTGTTDPSPGDPLAITRSVMSTYWATISTTSRRKMVHSPQGSAATVKLQNLAVDSLYSHGRIERASAVDIPPATTSRGFEGSDDDDDARKGSDDG